MKSTVNELLEAILTIPYDLDTHKKMKEELLKNITNWIIDLIFDKQITIFEAYQLGKIMEWARIKVSEDNS